MCLLKVLCKYNGHPNIKDTKKIVSMFDHIFFKNKLKKFDKYIITELDDDWGAIEFKKGKYRLYLTDNMSLNVYLGTIAHEMIHLFQMKKLKYDDFVEYDEIFLSFKVKFDEFNIDIF